MLQGSHKLNSVEGTAKRKAEGNHCTGCKVRFLGGRPFMEEPEEPSHMFQPRSLYLSLLLVSVPLSHTFKNSHPLVFFFLITALLWVTGSFTSNNLWHK